MNPYKKLNRRVGRLSLIDIKMTQLAAMFITIIIVKLFPGILGLNYWLLAILAVLCGIRPLCKILRSEGSGYSGATQ